MPFKSEAQRRWVYAKHPEMAKRWQEHTPKDKLPEKVKHAAFLDELTKIADLAGLVLSQLARREAAPPVTKALSDVEESIAEKWRRFSTPSLGI